MAKSPITSLIIIAEDNLSYRFLRYFCMRLLGIDGRRIRKSIEYRRAGREGRGAGDQVVIQRYPSEVQVLRRYNAKNASEGVRLVVHLDADNLEVRERHRQLDEALRASRFEVRVPSDPIALMVPKRHMETWIHGLAGGETTERDDYKKAPGFAGELENRLRPSAYRLAQLAADASMPVPENMPSLREALVEAKRLLG